MCDTIMRAEQPKAGFEAGESCLYIPNGSSLAVSIPFTIPKHGLPHRDNAASVVKRDLRFVIISRARSYNVAFENCNRSRETHNNPKRMDSDYRPKEGLQSLWVPSVNGNRGPMLLLQEKKQRTNIVAVLSGGLLDKQSKGTTAQRGNEGDRPETGSKRSCLSVLIKGGEQESRPAFAQSQTTWDRRRGSSPIRRFPRRFLLQSGAVQRRTIGWRKDQLTCDEDGTWIHFALPHAHLLNCDICTSYSYPRQPRLPDNRQDRTDKEITYKLPVDLILEEEDSFRSDEAPFRYASPALNR
uniref:Miff domain-containing protein n=2 Tax=Steinernema glaseri TaxID=37863 RepID=A0A1I8A4W8_9BILA